MADKKKQSADEIVDSMAEEMGVKDQEPDDSGDDLAADLGGIFGVSSKKKKKKTSEPVIEQKVVVVHNQDDEQDELLAAEPGREESSVEEEAFEVPRTPQKRAEAAPIKKAAPTTTSAAKKKKHELDGVFSPGKRSDADVDYSSSSYLDEGDLGGAVPGGGNKALIGVIVVLVLALIGVVLAVTPLGEDLKHLFSGDLNARRDAEVRKVEESFNAAQAAALAKYGNLNITGNPLYASIKLNGEMHYGQTGRGVWREVQLKPGYSSFSNLAVKEPQLIEVSSPGHDPATFELTEGKWQNNGGAFGFEYVATLTPRSEWDKMEFDARMGSDPDNEFFGTVTLQSVPAGASVLFNNKPLLDKQGEVLKTPVTFSAAYVKDEKSGKLEEVPVKVDSVLDQGHKVEIFFEDNADMPRYGTQLERQMWECTRKSEDDIKRLPKDHTIQHECDYGYTNTVDFNGLKTYIKGREDEKKRIEEYNASVKNIQERIAKGEPVSDEDIQALQKR